MRPSVIRELSRPNEALTYLGYIGSGPSLGRLHVARSSFSPLLPPRAPITLARERGSAREIQAPKEPRKGTRTPTRRREDTPPHDTLAELTFQGRASFTPPSSLRTLFLRDYSFLLPHSHQIYFLKG